MRVDAARSQEIKKEEEGRGRMPLCTEPWQNFYILRRGILPCCYGNPIGYSFVEWEEAWNSPQIQEIRRYLSQGKLSPYCLKCLGCPIVQRHLARRSSAVSSGAVPGFLRFLNRMMFRVPGKIYRRIKQE